MNSVSLGRVFLVLAFLIMIGSDVLTKFLWFKQFGFQPQKLGSILFSFVLFYFAYRGARPARWITVFFGVLGIVLCIIYGLTDSPLIIGVFISASTTVILLCLPQVTVFQASTRGDRVDRAGEGYLIRSKRR